MFETCMKLNPAPSPVEIHLGGKEASDVIKIVQFCRLLKTLRVESWPMTIASGYLKVRHLFVPIHY